MSAGRILIVDDTPSSLQLLTEILAAEGYDVRPADSGELALAAVAVSPPELILLDMRMPGMNGAEVCRNLKSRASSRDIPVIFLSASLEFEDRLEALEAGGVDFINRPFRREELLARLRTHLELARLRKDLELRVAARTAEFQAANDRLETELEHRRQIEGELRESEQRFRSIADNVPAAIWTTNGEGLVNYMNQWGLTFSGLTVEQLADSWLSTVHPEDLCRTIEATVGAVDRRSLYQIEHRVRRCDGEYRWLAHTGIPRFVNGEFAGHIGSSLDITELKRGQERALANQKLESLGVLTAGIAHDFNNLLSTILAHSDLALDEIPSDTPAHENVSSIATVALRAAEIVSQLMTYAGHTDSGTPEPVELSSLIHEMRQLLQVSVPSTTSLHLKLPKDPLSIRARPGQIRQVVLNLIVNGAEALEGRPGSVSVSLEKVGVGPLGTGEGNYVLLEVRDTGSGMTEEIKARIFDPFFSTKFLGRGLGLASVQGIVHAAGGTISVESTPGSGATFRVWLPGYDDAASDGTKT